jgi:hypothetical protein
MTPYEQAVALIALTEQTYLENYYGDNLAIFNRNEIEPGTDAGEQYLIPDQGK